MQLDEISYSDGIPVDGYGPGFFRVKGQVWNSAVLVLPGAVREWGGYDDTAVLIKAADQVDLVLVGTGGSLAPLPKAFRTALEDAGLGVEIMVSPTAARSYNMLLAEGRRVAVALLPV